MDNIIRYGIVGVGGYGGTRRKLLRETGRFQMVGGVEILDKTFEQAQAEEGKPLKRYPSVEALVADPEIEAVFISTPAHLHVEQAMIAAKAGKAIFVEKPLGHQYDECVKLVEYCEKNNIPHGHGFSARYGDLWQYVKHILDEKTLGQVVSVSVATMHAGGLSFDQKNWRFVSDRNPGGPLFQCGIHKIDLLRFLFGEGKWVGGCVNRTVTKSPTDDAYVLLGIFGGIPSTLHSHYVAAYRHAMEIYGTKGDLFITEYPIKLEYKATDLTAGFEPVYNIIEKIPKSSGEHASLIDFADAVRERKQPLMNGREGLKSLELVFTATKIATEIR